MSFPRNNPIYVRLYLRTHFRKLRNRQHMRKLWKIKPLISLFQISNVVSGRGLFGSHGSHVHVLYDNGQSLVGIAVNWGINSASIGFDSIETKGRKNWGKNRPTLKFSNNHLMFDFIDQKSWKTRFFVLRTIQMLLLWNVRKILITFGTL